MQKLVQQAIGTGVALLIVVGCTAVPAAPAGQPSSAGDATPSATARSIDVTATSVTPSPFTGLQSIDVCSYDLPIEFAGAGSTTMVLYHRMGKYKDDCRDVLPRVTTFTRVCSYAHARTRQVPQPRTST